MDTKQTQQGLFACIDYLGDGNACGATSFVAELLPLLDLAAGPRCDACGRFAYLVELV